MCPAETLAALLQSTPPPDTLLDGRIYLWIALGVGALALGVAVVLARNVISSDNGTPAMQDISNAIREGAEAFMAKQYRAIAVMAVVIAIALFAGYYASLSPSRRQDRHRLLDRRGLLGSLRLYRDVRLHPREHSHCSRRSLQHELCAADGAARRCRYGSGRRRALAYRRRRALPLLRRPRRSARGRLSARRLRLRRVAGRALRPARRRHLHQGGGRRRRPRRQGRGRHPGRRPAQPRRHRRPRRRQRRRLRRPWRGHLRVHGGRERRRHDPRGDALSGLRHQGHPLPAHRARLQPDRQHHRRHRRQVEGRRRPDARAQPRLLRHHVPRSARLRRRRPLHARRTAGGCWPAASSA